jgi:hypothetical protein
MRKYDVILDNRISAILRSYFRKEGLKVPYTQVPFGNESVFFYTPGKKTPLFVKGEALRFVYNESKNSWTIFPLDHPPAGLPTIEIAVLSENDPEEGEPILVKKNSDGKKLVMSCHKST